MKILLDMKIFVDLCFPSAKNHSAIQLLWQLVLSDKQTDTEFWMMQESLQRSLFYISRDNEDDDLSTIQEYINNIKVASLSPHDIFQVNRDAYKFRPDKHPIIAQHIYLFHQDEFDLILTSRKEDYFSFLDLEIWEFTHPTVLFTVNDYLGHLKTINVRVNEIQKRFSENINLFEQDEIGKNKAIENVFHEYSQKSIDDQTSVESPPNLEDFLIRCRGGGSRVIALIL